MLHKPPTERLGETWSRSRHAVIAPVPQLVPEVVEMWSQGKTKTAVGYPLRSSAVLLQSACRG